MCSESGINRTQVKKKTQEYSSFPPMTFRPGHPFPWGWKQCRFLGKAQPRFAQYALLQLRHQPGKQFCVSKPQPPTLEDFFLLCLLTEISATKPFLAPWTQPMAAAQHQPLSQRRFPQSLWTQAITQGPAGHALENTWGIPFHRAAKETNWKQMFTEGVFNKVSD